MSRPTDPAVTAAQAGRFFPQRRDDPKAGVNIDEPRVRGPPDLDALERARIVSLAEAARILGISEDGIRRHHAHLIRRLSPRRVGIRIGDLLNIGDDVT